MKLKQNELTFIIQAIRATIIKGEDAPMVAVVLKKIADELERIIKNGNKLEKDSSK